MQNLHCRSLKKTSFTELSYFIQNLEWEIVWLVVDGFLTGCDMAIIRAILGVVILFVIGVGSWSSETLVSDTDVSSL